MLSGAKLSSLSSPWNKARKLAFYCIPHHNGESPLKLSFLALLWPLPLP